MTCIVPEGGEYRIGTPITEQHRAALIERAELIESLPLDRRPDKVVAAISALLMAFPHKEMGDTGASMKLSAYRLAVEDIPTWAVEEGAKRLIRGDEGVREYAPSPPQFRAAAESVMKIAKGKAIHLRKLAAMPVARDLSEADRKAVVDRASSIINRVVDAKSIAPKSTTMDRTEAV